MICKLFEGRKDIRSKGDREKESKNFPKKSLKKVQKTVDKRNGKW